MSPTLRLMDVEDFSRPPAPIPWIVEGLAVRGAITLLAGEPGGGKSLLALAAAGAVAGGDSTGDYTAQRGTALVVDAENGPHEIHRRFRALGVPHVGVTVADAVGHDLSRNLPELEVLLHKLKPDLLVLDSMRTLWPKGEENDSAAVTQVLQPVSELVRKHDTACVLLHHVTKGQDIYRGSTAFAAIVQLGFRFGRLNQDREPGRRYVACFKCRFGPAPRTRWVRIKAVPDGVRMVGTTGRES